MNVDELILALQTIPNPSVTAVQVESDLADTPGALAVVDKDGVTSGGIDDTDGGTVILRQTDE